MTKRDAYASVSRRESIQLTALRAPAPSVVMHEAEHFAVEAAAVGIAGRAYPARDTTDPRICFH
ncbi:MAG: hypothetical protein Q8Q80_01695 [Methyloversatilis sp.]|uniref:hypothetical protein n=1 Tax=Methyloversatilis sp. TaxID=2569862 RepID=UPI002733A7C3|nr:hypothetical protein [Methyloversatilis sp.]MDP3871351.1 hypothetical protein [Methyloversatilis sp.]